MRRGLATVADTVAYKMVGEAADGVGEAARVGRFGR